MMYELNMIEFDTQEYNTVYKKISKLNLFQIQFDYNVFFFEIQK